MSLSSRSVYVALIAVFSASTIAIACSWDYDTIKMERTRFPSALELITGKFLRHSPEFYQWRIDDRLKRLETDPANAALLDDLAVAYDKTGQHDKALATAQKTETLHPNRYETAANLGTFYFHAGRLTEGLPHIERALQINPDAHFGREKYQQLLVEYIVDRRKDGPMKLPLAELNAYIHRSEGKSVTKPFLEMAAEPDYDPQGLTAPDLTVTNTFAEFIQLKSQGNKSTWKTDSAALKGILGMMKFGKHDSPPLLEALGSLLTRDISNPVDDAKLLAARAYLKASYEVSEGPSRMAYRNLAKKALYMQTSARDRSDQILLAKVEADFQKELAEARDWYAALRERELSWIRDGLDPEVEFDKLYGTEPEVSGMDVRDPRLTPNEKAEWIFVENASLCILFVAVSVALLFLINRVWRSRRAKARNMP